MKFLPAFILATTVVFGAFCAQASEGNVVDPNACVGNCFSTPLIRLAQDARWNRCDRTRRACRARCPGGGPHRDACLTRCGEAFEHCLGG